MKTVIFFLLFSLVAGAVCADTAFGSSTKNRLVDYESDRFNKSPDLVNTELDRFNKTPNFVDTEFERFNITSNIVDTALDRFNKMPF